MGDPACFLSETCMSCGRVLEGSQLGAAECVHCGTEIAPLDEREVAAETRKQG